MLITEILSRNARMNGRETAFIEREPEKNHRWRSPEKPLTTKPVPVPKR